MEHEKLRPRILKYNPESWRDAEGDSSLEERRSAPSALPRNRFGLRQRRHAHPDISDQTRVLELLGRINYKIISGNRVYIEVGGVVYKTLYGGYWRSVFTGIEHYLLRCEQVSGCVWAEEDTTGTAIDLPIVYSNEGWTAKGHSLSFMLSRD